MLNLACSGNPHWAFLPGKIINVVGDSSTGKTLLGLTISAECSHDPMFDDYDLIYDDAEHALEFDIKSLFGSKTFERLLGPSKDDGLEHPSNDMQSFRENIMNKLEESKPFVYILDSLDSLHSKEEKDKIKKQIDADKSGQNISGSYGTERAKMLSQLLRVCEADISKTKSYLIIISQTRQKIGSLFKQKDRAGGDALRFYSSWEMWLSIRGISKVVRKKITRQTGINTKVKVTKNRYTGKVREVEFPIYYDLGLDDIGSCAEFLIKGGLWKKSQGKVIADDINYNGSPADLPKFIEENKLTRRIKRKTVKLWNEIEEMASLKREKRYP